MDGLRTVLSSDSPCAVGLFVSSSIFEMAKQQSNICFLFNVPATVNNDALKRQIENLHRPNCIAEMKKTENAGCVRVLFQTPQDRDAFYAKRKSMRMDGKPVVVTRGKQGLAESRALIDNAVLNIAKRKLHEKPIVSCLFDVAQFQPAFNADGKKHLTKTTVRAGDFGSLMKVDVQLRRILFTECHEGREKKKRDLDSQDCERADPYLEEYGYSVMLESTPQANPDVAQELFLIPLEPGHTAVIECADILDQVADAIVLPSKSNLDVTDDEVDRRLLNDAGLTYKVKRQEYIERHEPLKLAESVVIEADSGKLPFKRVIHVSTEGGSKDVKTLLLKDLWELYYESALNEASRLQLHLSIAFPIITEGGSALISAQAAASKLKELLKRPDSPRLPNEIHFVHPDLSTVETFVDVFNSVFKYGASPAESIASRIMRLSTRTKSKVDEEDYDVGKLSIASGLSRPKDDDRTAADAAAAKVAAQWLEHEAQAGASKRPLAPPRPFGKRSVEEKNLRKAMTIEERRNVFFQRTQHFAMELNKNWPNQLVCSICDKAFAETSKSTGGAAEREVCQRCHRPFHFACIDAAVICGFCASIMQITVVGRCDDQPANGRMEIKVVELADATPPGFPDAKGHIVITYVFPSGTQGCKDPKPGEFYFGCTRMAYFPNNEAGRRICRMLKTAFERGLIMAIGLLTTGYGDHGVCWGLIAHKTSLTGGRSKWGYPDETYLGRVEKVLNTFGIGASTVQTTKDGDGRKHA